MAWSLSSLQRQSQQQYRRLVSAQRSASGCQQPNQQQHNNNNNFNNSNKHPSSSSSAWRQRLRLCSTTRRRRRFDGLGRFWRLWMVIIVMIMTIPLLLQKRQSSSYSTSSSRARFSLLSSSTATTTETNNDTTISFFSNIKLPPCRRINPSSKETSITTSSSSSSSTKPRFRFPTILTNANKNASCSTNNNTNTNNTNNTAITPRHAIAYLTQKRDFDKFLTSMDLLYQNYLSQNHGENSQNVDILIFHTDADVTMQDVINLEKRYHHHHHHHHHHNCIIFRFIDLSDSVYWSVPDHVARNDKNYSTWLGYPAFGIGYRLMIRFFALTLYDFLRDYAQVENGGCSYDYILRLDDDSYLLSPISYNLFDYLEQHDFHYAYRLCTYEMDNPLVLKQQQQQQQKQKLRSNKQHSPIRLSSFWNNNHHHRVELWDRYQQHLERCSSSSSSSTTSNSGPPPSSTMMQQHQSQQLFPYRPLDRRMCAFYNNFFMVKVDFLLQDHVQDFLHYIDDLGIIFRERLGDLTIQSMAVYAFLPSTKIHRFLDWSYSHFKLHHHNQATIDTVQNSVLKDKHHNNNTATTTTTTTITCPVFGALQAGYLDPHAETTMANFEKNVSKCPRRWGILKPYHKYALTAQDLSPSHAHVPKEYAATLRLQTIRRATVEVAGMGLLSG